MQIDIEKVKAFFKDTLIDTLDIVFIESDTESAIEAIMHVSQYHTQTMGILHGGATIALAESVAGVGSNSICQEDERCLGMQISASHITSAQKGDTVRAIGVLQHKGRASHVWNVDVFSEKTGDLISTIRVTNAVVKKGNSRKID